MEFVHVFVLTHLSLDKNGDVKSKNVAVTFDLFEAEDHRNKGVENDSQLGPLIKWKSSAPSRKK